MKTPISIAPALCLLTLATLDLNAGTIFYKAISATQSDASSGINTNNQYTTAVDGGNRGGTDRVVNGITLYSLIANGNSSTADNCTVNALAGSLSNAGGTSGSIQADGVFREVLSDMTFNIDAGDGSQQEIVLDPESLEAGMTYDLRVYIGNFSGQNRQVNLAFVGDGQAAVETGFFNEDDARTSGGGFSDPNQVYYINYRYTWDGDSTPGITITQKSGGAPFVLYALTNQIVPGGGATAQAPAPSGQGLTTGLVSEQVDQVGVQSDDFYNDESLINNGRWIDIEKYGRCWMPRNCARGWRPYVNGSWRYSDEDGWVFVSDEPWAWACYHYGRWVRVEFGCGWAWIPGTVWSGGWVSWRKGTDAACDCIAWAPLPPEVNVDVNVGVSTWVDQVYDIGPDYWTFVDLVNFGVDSFFGANVIYDFNRTVNVFNKTVNITNINVTNVTNVTNINNVNVYNGGPDYVALNKQIRDHGGQELSKVNVDRIADAGKIKGGKNSHLEGDKLAIHSPDVKKDGKHVPKTDAHLASNKIDHGWKGVKGDKKNQIKDHIAQENKGKSPKNTKATLPSDVAQKVGKHPAGGQGGTGTGTAAAGTGQHPGKAKKGPGTETLAGTQATGAGVDQHPGKGKRKGQGQLGTTGTGAIAGQGGTPGAFDQHPGKSKGKGQGQLGTAGAGRGATPSGVAGSAFDQHPGKGKHKGEGAVGAGAAVAGAGAGTGQTAGVTRQAGGGAGKHPGKSLKGTQAGTRTQAGAGGTTGTGPSGVTTAGGGGQPTGKHPGKGSQQGLTKIPSGSGATQGTTGTGQTSGVSGGKHGKQGAQGQASNVTNVPQGAGVTGAQGTSGGGGGKHGKKGGRGQASNLTNVPQGAGATKAQSISSGGGGKHGKQGPTSGLTNVAGSGGTQSTAGGGTHHKQQPQKQTFTQPSGGGGGAGGRKPQQVKASPQTLGGGGGQHGGGGGGGGKKAKPTPTPHK